MRKQVLDNSAAVLGLGRRRRRRHSRPMQRQPQKKEPSMVGKPSLLQRNTICYRKSSDHPKKKKVWVFGNEMKSKNNEIDDNPSNLTVAQSFAELHH